MSVAVCLLAYSMVVLVISPPILSQASASGAIPRWGIAVWLTAMISVVGAWLVAAVLFTVDLDRAWGQLDVLLAGCFAALRALALGGYGGLLQAGLAVLAALTLLTLGVLGSRVAATVRRSRIDTQRHAEAAQLAARGAPRGPDGALVLDVPQRGVYCLAGRERIIVITRPALSALDEAQLAAVLAHEHAHLAGRHHLLLSLSGALTKALPRVRLFSQANTEIARLAEMCADDVAARHHTRDIVVDALLALALPAPASGSPSPALSAAGIGVADRVQRLLQPPNRSRARLYQGLALSGLLLGPLTLAALMLTHSPLCMTAALG
jgi:hypothetical protein